MGIPIVDDAVNLFTGGGSESTSSSSSGTQTQDPHERSPEQDMMWDKYMSIIFTPQELWEAKQEEIDDLIYESENLSGWENLGRAVEISKQIKDLKHEQSKLNYSPPGWTDKVIGNVNKTYGTDIGGGEPQLGLEGLLQQNADAKREADYLMGAQALGLGVQNVQTQGDEIEKVNTANTQYGEKMGGVGDTYKTGLRENTNQWNTDNQSIMDAISPLAHSKPLNIKFGDFEMPFTTGTQASARNRFGKLNDKRLDVNTLLNEGIRDTDSGQAELLNRIAQMNSQNNINLADRKYNQGITTASLLNQIANNNLPASSLLQALDFAKEQANRIDTLNYSLPIINTTGSSSSEKEKTLGPLQVYDYLV